MPKYLRAAAGIGLGHTHKYMRGAAGTGLGTTIKYFRRSTSGAAGNDLCTTIKYLRGAAGVGLGTTTKYLRVTTGTCSSHNDAKLDRISVFLAPHTNGPRDVPRCGAMSLLKKSPPRGDSAGIAPRQNVEFCDLRDCLRG